MPGVLLHPPSLQIHAGTFIWPELHSDSATGTSRAVREEPPAGSAHAQWSINQLVLSSGSELTSLNGTALQCRGIISHVVLTQESSPVVFLLNSPGGTLSLLALSWPPWEHSDFQKISEMLSATLLMCCHQEQTRALAIRKLLSFQKEASDAFWDSTGCLGHLLSASKHIMTSTGDPAGEHVASNTALHAHS